MNFQSPEFTKTLTYLIEIETVAQDILTLRDTKLEIANTLGKLQESLRALQKTEDKRSFLKVGALFVEHSTEDCKLFIQKEIDNVKQQHHSISAELKEKLSKKRDIEHEPKITGICLQPLSHVEATALTQGFGVN